MTLKKALWGLFWVGLLVFIVEAPHAAAGVFTGLGLRLDGIYQGLYTFVARVFTP